LDAAKRLHHRCWKEMLALSSDFSDVKNLTKSHISPISMKKIKISISEG
jgi:hypothetical protein